MGYWSGKTVLVTGGSNGLGRVIAETFGAAGAQVAIVGLEAADVEATAEAMRDGGVDVLPLVADVTKPEDATRIVEETVAKFAEENGYDMILEASAFVYSAKSVDVTDMVLERMGVDPAKAIRSREDATNEGQ